MDEDDGSEEPPGAALPVDVEHAQDLEEADAADGRGGKHLARDSTHLINITKILTKNITNSCQQVTIKKSRNQKKSVVYTYLLFKLDFSENFCEDFRDVFKCIELRPCPFDPTASTTIDADTTIRSENGNECTVHYTGKSNGI